LRDASELLALASPEQIRGFIDLDVWLKDRLAPSEMTEWLQILAELGPDKIGRSVEALDPELIALYIKRILRVYDLSLGEEPPNEPEGHYYPTPDRFFLLDILPDGETGKAVERVIDWLYRYDLELARRVVMSAKWELDSDLEEWSYRFRTGRMADL